MDYILQSQPLFLFCVGLFSLIVGSFLNVVIWRLPKMLHESYKAQCYSFLNEAPAISTEASASFNLVYPNSQCVYCNIPIKPIDNIPLLSFILLRGRCRYCQNPISWRYPFIELFTVVLSLITAYFLGPTTKTLFALPLTWCLIVLSAIDFEHQILPDDITLPLLWIGIAINIFAIFTPLTDAVIGAIAGYLFLWSVYWLFKLITGKEGMGYGDFKLLAMLGAWFGWQVLPIILLFSAGIGAIVGISAIALKKITRSHPIPFGPFLAFAGWLVLLFHDKVIRWYGLLG